VRGVQVVGVPCVFGRFRNGPAVKSNDSVGTSHRSSDLVGGCLGRSEDRRLPSSGRGGRKKTSFEEKKSCRRTNCLERGGAETELHSSILSFSKTMGNTCPRTVDTRKGVGGGRGSRGEGFLVVGRFCRKLSGGVAQQCCAR